MSLNNNDRIYLQMRPDVVSAKILRDIGIQLAKKSTSGHRILRDELHLTLIHFGKGQSVLQSLRHEVELAFADYGKHLEDYLTATKALLTNNEYDLIPLRYERIGENNTYLTVRYAAPEELTHIHKEAYAELTKFLKACGVRDLEKFVNEEPNFRRSSTFNPHIIIYKGYVGPDPATPPPACKVRFADLIYDKYNNENKY